MKDESGWRRACLWLTLLLPLPSFIPLVHNLMALRDGRIPTGFIQYDQAYYAANGRQYFDEGFHLTYGNPYAGYGTPAIYSQPQLFLVGLLIQLGLDPGVSYNLFGLAALVFATWVAMSFYRVVVGTETLGKRLGFVCFYWGGGLVYFATLYHQLRTGSAAWATIFNSDDGANGWWLLNFGRNLIAPGESYYHGLFFLSVLLALQRRPGWAILCAGVLSLSHPFTGLDLFLSLVVYFAWEFTIQSGMCGLKELAAAGLGLMAHLGYYWFFLNRFEDHRALQEQWTLAWLYPRNVFVPVLALTGGLAAWRFLRGPGLREILREPKNRLFLSWFLAVFALTHHNLIVKARQPIHFAHGYDWTALFFLGAPVLMALLERLLSIQRSPLRVLAITAVMGLMLSDNITWFASFATPGVATNEIVLSRNQKAVLDWLDQHTAPPAIIVCEDKTISYMVSTYTRVRSWFGHKYNTPSSELRRAEVDAAFEKGVVLPAWDPALTYYVAARGRSWSPPANVVRLYENTEYAILGPPLTKSRSHP